MNKTFEGLGEFLGLGRRPVENPHIQAELRICAGPDLDSEHVRFESDNTTEIVLTGRDNSSLLLDYKDQIPLLRCEDVQSCMEEVGFDKVNEFNYKYVAVDGSTIGTLSNKISMCLMDLDLPETRHNIVADLEVCKGKGSKKMIKLTAPSDAPKINAFTAYVGDGLSCGSARACMDNMDEFDEDMKNKYSGYFNGPLLEISSYIDKKCKDGSKGDQLNSVKGDQLNSVFKELGELAKLDYLKLDIKKAFGVDSEATIDHYFPNIPRGATLVINQCYGDIPRTTLVLNDLEKDDNPNHDLSINVNKGMCQEQASCIGSLMKAGATETDRLMSIDGKNLPTKVSVYYTDKGLEDTKRLLEDCRPRLDDGDKDDGDKDDGDNDDDLLVLGLLVFLILAAAFFWRRPSGQRSGIPLNNTKRKLSRQSE